MNDNKLTKVVSPLMEVFKDNGRLKQLSLMIQN